MAENVPIRVSRQPRSRVVGMAQPNPTTTDQTVDRAQRQLSMGRELDTELTEKERAWLDAELDDH